MSVKNVKYHPAWKTYALVVPILLLAACQPATQPMPQDTNYPPASAIPTQIPTATPPETMTPATTASPSSMPAPTQGEGLTFEQMRSTTPPAPADFSAVIRNNVIRLEWTPAPKVTIPHAYSDTVISYNIYRYENDPASLTLLASVDALFYEDKTALPGVTYHYAVSAVHEGPLEGERTNDAAITAP